ncbi:hypothetical protein INR49_003055 [Caranx melampygus]|nr:hypothetical protein INR49_003055 [Caranx melampygus]
MVCLHPGAVTFSCVRSMNYLLSSHHSCTCMAFARLGGEFCQAQHLLLIVDNLKMNRPAPVEISYDCLRFLITHNPTNAQLGRFIEDLKAFGVNTLVRVCAATYDKTPVEQEGIHVLDWPFDDGSAPPDQVVDDWLNLLQTKAPVLVALALIECGMEYEDAVHFIRLKRRGAFNSKQLLYLESYKPKLCLRSKDANGQSCCVQ